MNKILATKDSMKDWAGWTAIAIVTLASLFCTYCYHFSTPILVMLWIGWLLVAFFLALLTSTGKKSFLFAKEAKIELEKVVWPTRQETIQTTSIVMVMVTVTGFVLWAIDSGMMWTIGKITHLG